jgi:hypothetical protein
MLLWVFTTHCLNKLSIYKLELALANRNADLDLPVPYWSVCCCGRWLMALRRASLLMASECLPSSSSRSLLPASYRVAACRLEHLLPRCYSQEGATGGSSALDTASNHFSYRGPLARTLTNLKVRVQLRQHMSTLCAAMLNDKGETRGLVLGPRLAGMLPAGLSSANCCVRRLLAWPAASQALPPRQSSCSCPRMGAWLQKSALPA